MALLSLQAVLHQPCALMAGGLVLRYPGCGGGGDRGVRDDA